MITEKEYIAALEIVTGYQKQENERKQKLFSVITEDLTAYFEANGPKAMLDFYLSLEVSGIIRVTFKGFESEDLDGNEPFLGFLELLSEKHGVRIRVPNYYFMK